MLLAGLTAAMLACSQPAARPNAATAAADPGRPSHTLVMVARVEPAAATARVDLSGGVDQDIVGRLFTAGLAFSDEHGVPRAYLAESLPRLDTDTWRVFPGGQMETTYRLRPNLVWHDGEPLTADDFVFALRVYTDPDVGALFKPDPQNLIESVDVPDPLTVVVRWKAMFPEAGALDSGKMGFIPLPRHILSAAIDRDPASVLSHPYWSREYVGAGPYQLGRWETGSFLEASAFDRHVLGKPAIERVRVVWIGDPNTALATLMAGEADFAADSSLEFQHAEILKHSWESERKGVILLNSREVRYVQIQARAQYANPGALLDLRVRRGLAYALDKQALLDGMLNGDGVAADTIVSPDADYYPALDRAITKYPYDPARAEQLFAEAGLGKGTDGFFGSSSGGFRPEVRGPGERELSILVDGWRKAGIDAAMSVTPAALATNNEYRATFPSLAITKSSLPERIGMTKYATADVAALENRWGGTNKGGYSNPAYDALLDRFNNALDRGQRAELIIAMMKLASDEVPSLPMYYDLTAVAHVSALKGPLRSAPEGLPFWNIHEWQWTS